MDRHCLVVRIALIALFGAPVSMGTPSFVTWTPEGVLKKEYRITVKAGDTLTFMCPIDAFSTIWFMKNFTQYEKCSCDSTCILAASCQYFSASNYTTTIQRLSGSLHNTPNYLPGQTYYFASFSENLASLSSSSVRSGGECLEMLKLELKVLSNGDHEVEDSSGDDRGDSTDPGSGLGDDGKPTDEDKTDSGGDKDTKPSISTDALISSSPSLSLTPTLLFSLPLLLTYLASRY